MLLFETYKESESMNLHNSGEDTRIFGIYCDYTVKKKSPKVKCEVYALN